ncbi:glucose-6-phosphate isomerase family protein [Cellulomonas xiejunii]|uniref:glucose-6-phosphate isomerase n=1 Tax=Cellulomonas xiejunii TaxID=2968083 RepID=A0ABY5KSA4_9CELL|nr:glucose-6-phosphate isomerase family protein [Cellulomonas xiejunii]MCC2321478.1 cupin domain-containing protein [Cellulomonas xiejunii]MCC2323370.1 cupin domain-containing protein [Cellulomonas xiejunii]UUI72051.1 cupin domain-containing protein [Cellulomonas xiejunii]
MTTDLAWPIALTIGVDGVMSGATGAYDKLLGDLDGVYLNDGAFAEAVAAQGHDRLAYHVDEHRYGSDPGALIVGTSTLLPGRVGDEFAMTRGHLHARADRAELYHCLSGRGVMLMDTVDGRSQAVPMTPGVAVHVPGHWVHRTVNVGDEPFVTLFCYAADAGQDYDLISDAGGMSQLVVTDGADGWITRPNPRHTGYGSAA